MILENCTLDELKSFITTQNLWGRYKVTPDSRNWYIYTSVEGIDEQSVDTEKGVCAKLWIQYFPLADAFSLNINFFALIDGSPIGPQDFIEKVPTATKIYEYYNSPKIRWVKQENIYIKEVPPNCVLKNYPAIDKIIQNTNYNIGT